MEERIISCAQSIIDSYNDDKKAQMRNECWILCQMISRQPNSFSRCKRPYIVFLALFYGISEGFCPGLKPVHMAYYFMMKTYNIGDAHDSVAVSKYAFLFLDSNFGLLLTSLMVQFFASNDDIIKILLGHLALFRDRFKGAEEKISLDSHTMILLEKRIDIYEKLFIYGSASFNALKVKARVEIDHILSNMQNAWMDEEEESVSAFEMLNNI